MIEEVEQNNDELRTKNTQIEEEIETLKVWVLINTFVGEKENANP